ncbi:hypothetical protein ACJA3J_12105 [Halobacillus sp. SY10]|uniref:hypothetical protein n=1 Tax=Halobacillus sp. SY10 TaxID=3381356 RepID=UPI003879DF9E
MKIENVEVENSHEVDNFDGSDLRVFVTDGENGKRYCFVYDRKKKVGADFDKVHRVDKTGMLVHPPEPRKGYEDIAEQIKQHPKVRLRALIKGNPE